VSISIPVNCSSSSFCNFPFLIYRFARPCFWVQVCLSDRTQLQSTQRSLRGGTQRASISFAIGQGTASCAISRYKKVACQRGNGITDSLPSGSGNLYVQPGRQRMPFAHPLRDRETRCNRRDVARAISNWDFCQAARNCGALFRPSNRLQSDRSCLWTLRASHRGVRK
jgi:hypothetical protein